MEMMRKGHQVDDDGCCEYCGADLAEAHWLRSQTPPELREPLEEWELYCLKREDDERRQRVYDR